MALEFEFIYDAALGVQARKTSRSSIADPARAQLGLVSAANRRPAILSSSPALALLFELDLAADTVRFDSSSGTRNVPVRGAEGRGSRLAPGALPFALGDSCIHGVRTARGTLGTSAPRPRFGYIR